MQHVGHRHSDEVHQLNLEIERLRAENEKLRHALKDTKMSATGKRFELRYGKYGPYFHDTMRGGGFDMPLDHVLEKLNRLEEYTLRLKAISDRTR